MTLTPFTRITGRRAARPLAALLAPLALLPLVPALADAQDATSFVAPAPEGQPPAGALVIEVPGVQALEGKMMIAVLGGADTWMSDDDMAAGAMVEVTSETVVQRFEGLAPGTYAVRLFHDVDADGKLGANVLGIPNEPYGFSNNAPARFGPASFEAASFTLGQDDVRQVIKLH